MTKKIIAFFILLAFSNLTNASDFREKKLKDPSLPIKVYFAGNIFSQKDLIGNLYLADAIFKISSGKYECFMVQNKVQQSVSHKNIRDQDLKGIMDSDLILLSFDGTELDSGTVVEFMVAKSLDKPAVIYRTDFRGGSGEQDSEFRINNDSKELNNKWNLMVSFYPRTEVVYMNAMIEYQSVYRNNIGENVDHISSVYSKNIAYHIVKAMDKVLKTNIILDSKEYLQLQSKLQKLMDVEM